MACGSLNTSPPPAAILPFNATTAPWPSRTVPLPDSVPASVSRAPLTAIVPLSTIPPPAEAAVNDASAVTATDTPAAIVSVPAAATPGPTPIEPVASTTIDAAWPLTPPIALLRLDGFCSDSPPS